ncbi:hypothetical protein OH807_05370 [Kitasatospora sp. NBC_01560]|uniref:hypothetical protein n=1 Tax=Kitasatospora sp. NBC_01560 TaxID=2975965 RepID=UPI0038656CC2
MRKGLLGRLGRRGATAAAVAALAAGAVGLAGGSASADTWYGLKAHETGHGVGVYAQPTSQSGKNFGDLWSTQLTGDAIDYQCWTRGETINNQGNVWYRVSQVYSANYGYGYGTSYVYGAYTDGNSLFHTVFQDGRVGQC